ncbi:PAS domain S-box protein [candidate division KSB1 bacterium]|nr:PAS domain S-box protein [candidate division KSB1 bacterium]
MSSEAMSEIHNSAQMLALILENKKQHLLLSQENIRLEEAVRERTTELLLNEERLKLALKGANDGLWDWNRQTNQVFFSPSWLSMLGYNHDELETHFDSWKALIHPDDVDIALEVFESHFRGDTPSIEIEYRLKSKSGDWIWILNRGKAVQRDENQLPLRAVGTHTKINDRKMAEEALRASEEKYRQLFELAQEGIWVIDKDANTLLVNSSMAKMLGYTIDEMIGKHLFTFMDAQGVELCKQNLLRRERGISEQHDFEFIRKTGERFYAAIETAPMFDNNGNYTGAVAGIVDITERKKSEDEIRQLNDELEARVLKRTEELERLNRELKDFAYIVSHDLKAPLRAVSQLAYWINHDYHNKIDDQGRQYLEILMNRVKRMDRLIEGILEYSRLGRVRETINEISVEKTINDVLELLSPPANFKITVEQPMPFIQFDLTRLEQIFQNLIGNAIKYMDKTDANISIGVEERPDFWIFHVKDNGPGIEKKHFERIFKIFQTLHARDEIESTGIGLTLVQKIIEQYGGRIWIESTINEGSTFYFTIRRQNVDVPAEEYVLIQKVQA